MKEINYEGKKITLKEMTEMELAYRVGNPIVTDKVWDYLVKETGYEEKIGETCLMSKSGRQMFPMKAPLCSLYKTGTKDTLFDFINKINKPLVIEPKLDGNACVVVYKVQPDGTAKKIRLGSGGDGLLMIATWPEALDFVTLHGIPETLSVDTVSKFRENGCVIDETIEIRGEIIADKDYWSKVNPGVEYNTWRQMIAAIMNRQRGNSWKAVLSRLSIGKFAASDKKNENTKILAKLGVIKALSEKFDINLLSFEVVEDPVYGKKCNMIYDKEMVSSFDTILTTLINNPKVVINAFEEEATLITYSVASDKGNADLDFLYEIPELLTFKTVKSEDVTDKELNNPEFLCSKRIITSSKESDFIVKYIGNFFGNTEWHPEAKQVFKDCGRYVCDGLVFKAKNTYDKGVFRTGTIAHHPNVDRIAVKLLPVGIPTVIRKIWEETTELGNVTMHAKIDPIEFDGAIIENINLFNKNWLALRPWIKEGARVDVCMSAGLIPVLFNPTTGEH